jgi:hypothetical protein
VNRGVVVAVLAVLTVVLVVVVGRRFVERVPVTVRRGASAEVRRQPRLAFERLLAEGGVEPRTVTLTADVSLPVPAMLWLDESAVDLSIAARDAMWAWVARGGTLVLSPGMDGSPLSDALGVRRRRPILEDTMVIDAPAARRVVDVHLPGQTDTYRIDAQEGFLLASPAAWSVGDGAGGLALAEIRRDRGRVLIVAGLADLWTNDQIGEHAHALLLWDLATLEDAPLLFTAIPEPALLPGQVARRGWPVLVAAAVLALLALWRVWPRRGPMWVPPAPERRQLREHVVALGRFLLHDRQHVTLAAMAQHVVGERLRRQPWQERPADRHALDARPSNGHELLTTLQRLQQLWRRLHRA